MEHRLFVYGTLMRGEPNARHLDRARFLGPTATAPGYRLVWHGAYPALVEAPGAEGGVQGELYVVSAARLRALDAFEDVPGLYVRRAVRLADGTTAEAYLLPADSPGADVIPSGDWRRRPGGPHR